MRRARTVLIALILTPFLLTLLGIGLELWHLQPGSAQEFARSLQAADGFNVELVASEPQLVHPMVMNFDERGRLWIIESPTVASPGVEASPGRIKILESSRGDGTFDTVIPVPLKVAMPSALALGYGGLWLIDAPDLLFYPRQGDTFGPPEVVLSGFGKQDTNGLPNSLTWGPDGWLYGLSSTWSKSHIEYRGKTYDFSCAMYRLHPRMREFEIFCEGTTNPWGLTWDSEGNAFVSTCVTEHLWQFTETGAY